MDSDVPSPIDLRNMLDAREWEQSAMEKRPYRAEFFAHFAAELSATSPAISRVLELGSGPGFLAEHLLKTLPGISYVMLDFSAAMHELAKVRLGGLTDRVEFVERSFKEPCWTKGLGQFEAVVTNQAVHELRHKRYASTLHSQVLLSLLREGGCYLVCDHFVGEGGMKNDRLYMSVEEQRLSLLTAGFSNVRQVLLKGSLVLHHAT
jgi:SAM-dependent methyltransferase